MALYTTGEIAKLCGVSVRTVQYYDSRNILSPSALSEGGRRLYSDEDLKRMQIICFLREMDFSLNQIGELFSEPHPEKVIVLLLEQQEQALRMEVQEGQRKLETLGNVKRGLKNIENFSVDSLGDIAYVVKNRKKRRTLLSRMLLVGFLMDAIEIGTLIYGGLTGIWWPVAVGLLVVAALGVGISCVYVHRIAYICPECHSHFRPRLRSALWAAHTLSTRRLTCPNCGHRGFCAEVYFTKEQ